MRKQHSKLFTRKVDQGVFKLLKVSEVFSLYPTVQLFYLCQCRSISAIGEFSKFADYIGQAATQIDKIEARQAPAW